MRGLAMTTILDTLALVLIAAGVVGGAWAYTGPWSLSIGGVVVLCGSWLASREPGKADDQ